MSTTVPCIDPSTASRRVNYLSTDIVDIRQTKRPMWGLTTMGYSRAGGAPTEMLIRLEGETRWRRLMVWQTSNAGTLFVRLKGVPHIVVSLAPIFKV